MDTTTLPANDTDLDLIVYFDEAHVDVVCDDVTRKHNDHLDVHGIDHRCDDCGHDEDDATWHPYCRDCHDGLGCTTPERVADVRAAHARVCGGDAAYDGSDGESDALDAREE